MSTILDTDLFLAQRGAVLHHVAAVDLKKADNLWTPDDIPQGTLLNWFDATDASTIDLVDGGVSEWRDKVASGERFVQSGSPIRPPTDGAFIGDASNVLSSWLDKSIIPPQRAFPLTEVTVFRGFEPPFVPTGTVIPIVGVLPGLRQGLAAVQVFTGMWWLCSMHSTIGDGVAIRQHARQMPAEGVPYVTMQSFVVGGAGTTDDWDFRVNGEWVVPTNMVQLQGALQEDRRLCHIPTSQYLLLSGSVGANIDLVDKIEGWAAHEFGFAQDLPVNHPYRDAPPTR